MVSLALSRERFSWGNCGALHLGEEETYSQGPRESSEFGSTSLGWRSAFQRCDNPPLSTQPRREPTPSRDIPKLEPHQPPHHFPLDLPPPHQITYKCTDYLQDNLRSLTTESVDAPDPVCRRPEAALRARRRAAPERSRRVSRAKFELPRARDYDDNSNVSKILPLTTFRTIDLGGGKIPGRLFSRFCAESRVFYSN